MVPPNSRLIHLPSAFRLLDPHPATSSDGLRPAFFLDFDGTLAEIVDRPDDARLEPATKQVLMRLAARFPTAIVSGRALEDVRRRVEISELTYIGCHGFEIEAASAPSLGAVDRNEIASSIDRAVEILEPVVARIDGAALEHKPFALTIHFRMVDEAGVKALRQAVASALPHLPSLREAQGKKILELRPRVRWGKGDAIRAVWKALERDGIRYRPFVFGDDLTDEDSFAALSSRGHAIFVGSALDRETAATHVLASPAEVTAFLRAMIEEPSGSWPR